MLLKINSLDFWQIGIVWLCFLLLFLEWYWVLFFLLGCLLFEISLYRENDLFIIMMYIEFNKRFYGMIVYFKVILIFLGVEELR